jgi:hypothetical protein
MVPLRFTDRKSGKARLLCLRSDRRKVYLDSGKAQRLNSTKKTEYVSFSMFAEGGSHILQRHVYYDAYKTYTCIDERVASIKMGRFVG